MLVRYRQQQVNRRRAIKLRIGALLREQRVRNTEYPRWRKPWLEWLRTGAQLSLQGRWVVEQHLEELETLKARIAKAEKQLLQATAEDVLVSRLQRLAGIGRVTAWMLRAEVGRFDRFNTGKQLARFCGLTPRNASSGMRQADAGLIRAANPMLRSTLIEAAHRLARFDPHWKALATRMRAKGKPTNVAIAAVANRWIRWLFHEVPRMGAA
jgi:transposase